MGRSIPSLGKMTSGATNIIQSELGGLPSPSETRTANAAWGAGAGLAPSQGMDFLGQRGGRLYRSEIENRQRQGIEDLLKFLQGYSGTVVPTTGQELSYGLARDQREFDQAMSLREKQLAEAEMSRERYKRGMFAQPGLNHWTSPSGS